MTDSVIGKTFPTLNGQGFVRVVDCFGEDKSIVEAARLTVKGKKARGDDAHLIRYLMRHRHSTPFEFCEIVLHWRVPMDCWRQVIRHRTASVNEYSTRYSDAIDECQITDPSEWRTQSKENRQGSAGFLSATSENQVDGYLLSSKEDKLQRFAREVYEERLEAGVAREQARKDLPLSTFTEAYWKIDLHNLLHFLSLRMDAHAQKEVREYATVIGEDIVAKWVPITWEAFQDYRLNAVTLSKRDQEVIALRDASLDGDLGEMLRQWGWVVCSDSGDLILPRNRERDECETKLIRLGITPPWDKIGG